MTKIFISYSHDDSAWVLELWRAMRDRLHYDAWIDQKIVAATDWWASILRQIEACECFVIVLTRKSTESIFCQAELAYALALNKPVLPLLLKECVYPQNLTEKRVHYKDLTEHKPLTDVLLDISLSVNRVTTDTILGKFPPQNAPIPDEPKARDAASLRELLSKATDALENGNPALAEQLCKRVIESGNAVMGEAARNLLHDLQTSRERANAYDGVKMLLDGGERLARTAPNAWRKLVELYGADPDPDDLAGKVQALGAQKPPAPSVVSPPPPPIDTLQAALTRARDFHKTGKRNADWTPFLVTFNDLKIPDMKFCLVPRGTFQMGNDNEAYDLFTEGIPDGGKKTFTQPFYIAQTPVTNMQWSVAVKAGVVKEPRGADSLKWYKDPAMANAPVVGVNWHDCQKFAAWAGCRLPTEREWEYAARGIENLIFPWGNEWDGDKAVWDENSGGQPNDVSSRPNGQSWVGASHLSGNVWEWCSTQYQPYSYVETDRRENLTSDRWRVLRGGSWGNVNSDFLRAACRFRNNVDNSGIIRGFRLARSSLMK